MSPLELTLKIKELYHQRPFRPFRVFLKDGTYYDIRHMHNNIVGRNILVIGIPRPDDPDPWPIATHSVNVPPDEIDRVELLPTANSTTRE